MNLNFSISMNLCHLIMRSINKFKNTKIKDLILLIINLGN